MNIKGYMFEGPFDYEKGFEGVVACVYAVVSDKKLIYVGMTQDLNERMNNHHRKDCWKMKTSDSNVLYVRQISQSAERQRVERELINYFSPTCNQL